MDRTERAYSAHLSERHDNGLLRTLHPVQTPAARELVVDGRRYINFASNNYLALTHHPALIAQSRDWAERYGAGSGASRLVTGNLDLFDAIEAKVAALKGTAAALIMASGFQANASVLQALLDKKILGAEPLVFADRLNHASMHFGCAAAGVRQIRYRHCDMDHLKSLLDTNGNKDQPRFILTESVFSMDGDVAPIGGIAALAAAYDCTLICDDAHATGILGEQGCGLSSGADIVIGTFSKALGSFGAYVACSGIVKNYLINCCGGLIYSTALPPPVLGAIDAALDLLPNLDAEREITAQHAQMFRTEIQSLGFETWSSTTQIVPVILGTAHAAESLSAELRENGFWSTPIRPPTVPADTARLRITFTAAHTDTDVQRLIAVLKGWRKTSDAPREQSTRQITAQP
ncbi:8-amino-7-oxononanoate synthase [bacterium MnTg02]|nr:8-amino-7-oxononanoate synthase [bacterium MnTg02]